MGPRFCCLLAQLFDRLPLRVPLGIAVGVHEEHPHTVPLAQLGGVVGITQKAGVALHQVSCCRVKDGLQLQVVIVPDTAFGQVSIIDQDKTDCRVWEFITMAIK